MKTKSLLAILFIFIVGCSSSSSSERSENNSLEHSGIVNWATQIASLENRLKIEVVQFSALSGLIVSRPPTRDELSQLTKESNNITALYNEIINITPPIEAKSIHNKYIDHYAKTADYALYYVIAVKQNDLSYFEKSVNAVQDANRIGAEAYNDFEAILSKYSISCEEINFCD
ncbi:MAG TPA: hypothetical protein DCP32_09955 [Anaerolineaceae bacterium]|nr:hypothetical protein [Anaerolineaceae bacterium]